MNKTKPEIDIPIRTNGILPLIKDDGLSGVFGTFTPRGSFLFLTAIKKPVLQVVMCIVASN